MGLNFAIAATILVVGTAEVSAQSAPGPGSPPLLRPFARLFGSPPASAEPRRLFDAAPRKRLQELPSGTKCHIVVVPADPTIDPRFSVAPESKTRFLIREIPVDRVCR